MFFKDIKTHVDLIKFLHTNGENHGYYHHYTDLKSAIGIIESGYFFLTRGNSMRMNDYQEVTKGSPEIWKKTYIGSFSYGTNEIMAMWGLYSLPWENGVRISIPKDEMVNWIKYCIRVYPVDSDNNVSYSNILDGELEINLTDVTYINEIKCKHSSVLHWKNKTLQIQNDSPLQNISDCKEMTGYIKNSAWQYENEVRILIKLQKEISQDKIAIKIPAAVMNKLIIMTGPYFRDNINGIINPKKIRQSKFTNLVNYRNLCSDCEYKNKLNDYNK